MALSGGHLFPPYGSTCRVVPPFSSVDTPPPLLPKIPAPGKCSFNELNKQSWSLFTICHVILIHAMTVVKLVYIVYFITLFTLHLIHEAEHIK